MIFCNFDSSVQVMLGAIPLLIPDPPRPKLESREEGDNLIKLDQ